MMQWIDGVLSRGDKVEFFHDEFRCPVYVKDVVAIILAVTNKWISGVMFVIFSYMSSNISCSIQNVHPKLFYVDNRQCS